MALQRVPAKRGYSLKISQEGHNLILRLHDHLGLNRSAVMELALRVLAEREGLRQRPDERLADLAEGNP